MRETNPPGLPLGCQPTTPQTSGGKKTNILKASGGYGGGVPPLPIPNREVKPARADGTAMQCGRVGHRLFSFLAARKRQRAAREEPPKDYFGGFFVLFLYVYLPINLFLSFLHAFYNNFVELLCTYSYTIILKHYGNSIVFLLFYPCNLLGLTLQQKLTTYNLL